MRSLRQITLSHENSFTQKHFNDIGIVIEEKNDSLQRNLVVFLGKEPTSPFVRGNHSYPPLRRPALASPPYPRLTLFGHVGVRASCARDMGRARHAILPQGRKRLRNEQEDYFTTAQLISRRNVTGKQYQHTNSPY